MMLLSCEKNSETGGFEITTQICGNFKENIPRSSSTQVITVLRQKTDKNPPIIAIKCYDGILKTVCLPLDTTTGTASNKMNINSLRMDDLNVINLVFLNGYENPTIGMVCQEPDESIFIKVYEFDAYNNKDIKNLLWKRSINDDEAFCIAMPEPSGGMILIGQQTITCIMHNDIMHKSPAFLNNGLVTSYCLIDDDGHRYLLSNLIGELFLMVIDFVEVGANRNNASASTSSAEPGTSVSIQFQFQQKNAKSYKINKINFEKLGQTTIVENMTYIDNGVIFIASKFGDSQLIKLLEQPDSDGDGSYIRVLETYTNLGPILDMMIVDIEKQGQGQLITCSGGHHTGSLRVIRSGIGIQESANVELAGIKAMWPLRVSYCINDDDNKYDDHLVLSFYGYTRIFSISPNEEIEEVDVNGIDTSVQTFYCGNVLFKQFLQVTNSSINLIKSFKADCQLVDCWKIPSNQTISVATCNKSQCLIASRDTIFYFEIDDSKLNLVK
jgi:DNA damage-binding protein 1